MTDSTSPKPFIFVLMPFANEFDDVYKLGIKTACQEAGTYCERVDEQIFTESILERVYNQIAKCDLIISDMSGRNPNVFYETGYAHALGKQVILLTQNVNDIPFDMKHYPHIVYDRNNISQLKTELIKRVSWLIQYPKQPLDEIDFTLLYYFKGDKLVDNEEFKLIPFILQHLDAAILNINISIHNPTSKILDFSSIQIGLIGPWATGHQIDVLKDYAAMEKSTRNFSGTMSLSSKENLTDLPDDMSLFLFTLPTKMLPESWINLYCRVAVSEASEFQKDGISCTLRTFTNFGAKNLNFKILFGEPLIFKSQEPKKTLKN